MTSPRPGSRTSSPAKGNQPTILYFHGNGANAANRAPKIETMRQNGFGVFYLNNRGYGGSGGWPTEENNVADAIAAYDYLIGFGVLAKNIVAESLGSGQAVRLAAERPVAAVVLEAPLTSTVDVGRTSDQGWRIFHPITGFRRRRHFLRGARPWKCRT